MPLSPPPITLSNAMPASEATIPSPGANGEAARADHKHPRPSSVQRVTLDANGLATVTYTRSFASKPGVIPCAVNPNPPGGRPVLVEIVSDVVVNGLYTGVNIKGYRSQPLPTLAGVSGLLTAVITGINSLVSALSGFDLFSTPAAGVEVSIAALDQTVAS